MRRGPASQLPGLLLLVTLALAWPQSLTQAQAQEPCLKLVFNRFCLGGDSTLLLQREPPVLRQDDGERMALVYYDGSDSLYVLAWRTRIYKVVRSYRIASQLRFDELYRLLRDKYGPGEDRSRFSPAANTPGRRQIAIRRGEGQAVQAWPLAEGWRIELSWTRELGLALSYVADDLDRQQAAAMYSGF
ncbi:MAG: hypothetical protein EA400_10000 [Chromatiaceae bacterium]|nr:MAG: hypothetical protein EA400_10000 [Chromatiaceae bacterium]